MPINNFPVALILFFMTSIPGVAVAQSELPPPVVTPQDVPYPGVIRLVVDATDIDRHIFFVHETIPVRGGESLTLMYPSGCPRITRPADASISWLDS